MDKADILELTVSYLKLTKFEEAEVSMATKRQYKSGYLSCARTALKFMEESTTVNHVVKTNLENHLTNQCDVTGTTEYNRHLNIPYTSTCTRVQPVREPIQIQIPTASFSSHIQQGQSGTKANMLMLADQCKKHTRNDVSLGTESFLTIRNKRYSPDYLDVKKPETEQYSPVYLNVKRQETEQYSPDYLNVKRPETKQYSPDYLDVKRPETEQYSPDYLDVKRPEIEQYSPDYLDILRPENTHSLNLSSASDNSFNGGSVWRPW